MDNENKWEYDYSSQDKNESGDTGYPNVGSSGMNTANQYNDPQPEPETAYTAPQTDNGAGGATPPVHPVQPQDAQPPKKKKKFNGKRVARSAVALVLAAAMGFAGGFVGARIMTQLADRYELCSFPKGMLAAANETAVQEHICRTQPDVILHTAAISDTGYSEKHPEESYRANVLLPLWMAQAAKRVGAKLICFSSDQVYTGLNENGPFAEEQPLCPANVYGRHKWEAEQRVLSALPDAVMLRATWMYDLPGYGLPIRGNFVLNLLTAAMRQQTVRFSCHDYRGITYVREAVEKLTQVMELPGGIYNFGSENDCDMYETALRACEQLNIRPDIEKQDWKRSLRMDGSKLRAAAGSGFSDLQTGLMQCLRDYGLQM